MPSLLFYIKKALNLLTPPLVMPYRGYGTRERVFVHGHVLDDRRLYEAQHSDRRRKNFKAMISRYLGVVIPDVRVQIEMAGRKQVVRTNEDGYFQVTFDFDPPLIQEGWLDVRYQVLDEVAGEKGPACEGEVYVRESGSEYGVISDVDDTILVSHATELLKKVRLILTKNARTRLPFAGVAAFYRALRTGRHPETCNPIFYVSSSEWNLHDFLVDFCEARDIPKGPFLLQNLKQNLWELIWSGGGTHEHKYEKVAHLLETFSDLNFILIGDSGQRDAELYARAAREHPGRILAIYIRDVAGDHKGEQVRELSRRITGGNGVPMQLVDDTAAAARHAWEQGWITEEEYEAVVEAG